MKHASYRVVTIGDNNFPKYGISTRSGSASHHLHSGAIQHVLKMLEGNGTSRDKRRVILMKKELTL